jgi:hypothetical protein
VRHPCQEGDHHAQGHPAGQENKGGEGLGCLTHDVKKTQKINKKFRVLLNPPKTVSVFGFVVVFVVVIVQVANMCTWYMFSVFGDTDVELFRLCCMNLRYWLIFSIQVACILSQVCMQLHC